MKEVYIKTKEIDSWIMDKDYFKNKDLISIEELIAIIEDQDSEIEHLKETIEDIKQDIEDNYERISISSQVGMIDSDFH